MHEKREICSVQVARRESRIVKQGRERVTDGVADHPVNVCSPIERVGAIELKHFVERDLAGRRRLRHGRIGEFATFSKGKQARG